MPRALGGYQGDSSVVRRVGEDEGDVEDEEERQGGDLPEVARLKQMARASGIAVQVQSVPTPSPRALLPSVASLRDIK